MIDRVMVYDIANRWPTSLAVRQHRLRELEAQVQKQKECIDNALQKKVLVK